MNKIMFHLPGAFEYFPIYYAIIPIFTAEKNKFYDYFEIGSIYGSTTQLIWSAGAVNYDEIYLPSKKIKEFYDKNGISIAIEATNLLLEKTDLFNSVANRLFKDYHETKNEVIIGSELLKELVDILYPKYNKISSSNKCLSKEETIKELNKNYNRVELNPTLNFDYDFLNSLGNTQKGKIEIILNPICMNFCGKIIEHYKAMSYDMLYRDNTALEFSCEWQNKSFIERLKNNFIIKNNDIIEKYMKTGIINYKIIGKNSTMHDIIFTLLYYLVKPEYYLDILNTLFINISKQKNEY